MVVERGLSNILVNPIRNLNYRFMIAEWLWIQAGLNDVHILAQYNSVMKKFSDDGQILSGAYGPRLMPQMRYILENLKKPESRQAVATIWTPDPSDSKDIPCTISIQWFVRDGFVHCTVNMRSSDVWLGLPYDYFTFSQITNYVAMRLGRPVGSITMNLASSHLYETQWETANQLVDSDFIPSPHLPRHEGVPSTEAISFMLTSPPTSLHNQKGKWLQYFQALSQNSQYAMESLRGIAAEDRAIIEDGLFPPDVKTRSIS